MDQVRIDKWLWAAHVQNAQRGDRGRTWGRVHVNGERVKPSKAVRTGDTIEVTIKTFRHTLVVTGIAERRGPASDALTLYEETPSRSPPANCTLPNVGFPVRSEPTSAHAPPSRRGAASTHCAADGGAHAERRPRAPSIRLLSAIASWLSAWTPHVIRFTRRTRCGHPF